MADRPAYPAGMSDSVLLPYTRHCFVCGAHNPHGLQLRFRGEPGGVRAEFRPRAAHAGYTGIVHGGVVASALDEIMFWAAAYAGRQFYLSAEMNIRWSRKVVVDQAYRLVGRQVRQQRRVCFTAAELLDENHHACASATGKYLPLRAADVPLRVEDFVPDPQTLPISDFLPRLG
jgi:uncharacterized protein (TIGR00369 family)